MIDGEPRCDFRFIRAMEKAFGSSFGGQNRTQFEPALKASEHAEALTPPAGAEHFAVSSSGSK